MDRRVSQAARMFELLMGEQVNYEQIAAAVGLSRHRFHHLFVEQTGEPPGEYLRRIRLDAAATRLRWTNERVGQIAHAVGYASQPSFNKAFERRYGMQPIAFRKDRVRFPNDPAETLANKQVRLIESPGFRLLAKRYVGAPCYVPDYWADFLAALPAGLDGQGRHLFLGIMRDDMRFTPPEQVRYDCCVTVSEAFSRSDIESLWPELSLITLEPSLCASMSYQGYYAASDNPEAKSISHAFGYLLDYWMPKSRYSFAGDYAAEIYSIPHGHGAPEPLACTILVPVV